MRSRQPGGETRRTWSRVLMMRARPCDLAEPLPPPPPHDRHRHPACSPVPRISPQLPAPSPRRIPATPLSIARRATRMSAGGTSAASWMCTSRSAPCQYCAAVPPPRVHLESRHSLHIEWRRNRNRNKDTGKDSQTDGIPPPIKHDAHLPAFHDTYPRTSPDALVRHALEPGRRRDGALVLLRERERLRQDDLARGDPEGVLAQRRGQFRHRVEQDVRVCSRW